MHQHGAANFNAYNWPNNSAVPVAASVDHAKFGNGVKMDFAGPTKYGRSSEQLEHTHLELMGGMVAAPAAEPASNVTAIEAGRRKRLSKPRPGLRELPEHLPRRTVVHAALSGHDGGCDCQACGRALREIAQDVSEVLDYESGSFHVVRHVRPRLACSGCKTITQAAAPSRGHRSQELPAPGGHPV